MSKGNVLTTAEIPLSIAYWLMNTECHHAAAKMLKESLSLLTLSLENFITSTTKKGSKETDCTQIEKYILKLAEVYFHTGEKEESKEDPEPTLRISRQIVDINVDQRLCNILSSVLFALGRYEKGIDYCKEALSVSQETGDAKAEAKIYYKLGEMLYCRGQTQNAVEYLQKSIEKSKGIGERWTEGKALITLGKALFVLGKIRESYQKAERALEISKETRDREMEAGALRFLGTALYALTKASESLRKLEQSLKISEEIGDNVGRGNTLKLMGMIYGNFEKYEESMKCHLDALQVWRKIHDREKEGNAYLYFSKMFTKRRQYKEAEKYLEDALAISKETGNELLKDEVCISLYDVNLKLGQHDRAQECKELVLKSMKEAGARKLPRSMTLFSLSIHLALNGRLEEALHVSAESIRCYESERESLGDEYKLSLGNMCCYILTYKSHCRYLIYFGNFVDALCTAEQNRARLLAELLVRQYDILETFHFRRVHLSRLMTLLTKEQLLVFIQTGLGMTVFWVMQNKEPRLEMLHECESNKYSVNDFIEITLQETSRLFTDGRDVDCEDRSPSALYGDECPANDKEPKKRRMRHSSGDWRHKQLSAPKELYNMLIAPFADRIQGREIVLVPEGAMFMVPFAALQDDSGKYLSETCKIRIVPSLTTLKLIYDSPADYHSQTGALIVGNPQVSHVTPLRQLPAAKQEAQDIADLLKVTPLLGEQATKEEVLRRITNVCLIHIAAHGDAERGEIAFTPNPSSPQVPRKEDYMLTMEDIMKVGIRAKLVVLSCCHSAKGEIMKAEGVVGIARAFIASGARSVLVSLWAVNDESTKEFMIHFYGHLVHDKLSASEALHQTMKWMRGSKEYDIRHWAPFILIGDDVTVDL